MGGLGFRVSGFSAPVLWHYLLADMYYEGEGIKFITAFLEGCCGSLDGFLPFAAFQRVLLYAWDIPYMYVYIYIYSYVRTYIHTYIDRASGS